MKLPSRADIIKFAAVATAIPRWVVALMASEGLVLPIEWRQLWVVFSALAATGMAIVEGIAFAYVFNAWKRERNPTTAGRMLMLAVVSAVLFVVLLTPSIVASVEGVVLGQVLSDWMMWLWGAVVAASTIAIVASVGYAEKSLSQGQRVDNVPIMSTQMSADVADGGDIIPTFGRGYQGFMDYVRWCETNGRSLPDKPTIAREMSRSVKQIGRYLDIMRNSS